MRSTLEELSTATFALTPIAEAISKKQNSLWHIYRAPISTIFQEGHFAGSSPVT